MKLKTNKMLAPAKSILAIPDHYVNLTGAIAFADLSGLKKNNTDVYGTANVIQAGTLIYMDNNGVVTKPTTTNAPNGVIFNTIFIDDYDSTDTKVNATVLVHGFVRPSRLVELTSGDTGLLSNKMIQLMA